MNDRRNGLRGIVVYAFVAVAGVTIVALWLHLRGVSVGDPSAGALIMTAMWIPAIARVVATRTADRDWHAPFPLKRWGRPRLAIVLVPLGIVTGVYAGAYGGASLAGVVREAPVWHGGAVIINLAVNLPLLAAIDLVGGLGEEIGWRGYLQPRLDRLQVPCSLLWVIALECLFHLPLIVLAGYVESERWTTSAVLFFGLKLGATPLWTWATYRWRSIWVAAWFHAFHNAVSQVLLPKMLGAGPPLILGESGMLPVAAYLLATIAMLAVLRWRSESWRSFALKALA